MSDKIGKIIGKSDIYSFKIEIFGDIRNFDFLSVSHYEYGEVLSQVFNIIRDGEVLIGECKVIGYKEDGILKNIRTPFSQDSNIRLANDKEIKKTIGLSSEREQFLGLLEHHPEIKISLDLKKTITKHIAILAKSGAGKSYTVGVLLEEIMKKNIPILILDPHNEYSSLKYPNSNKKDTKRLEQLNLEPLGFSDRVKEFSPDIKTNPQSSHITLNLSSLTAQDLIDSFPQKLSSSQQGLLFSTLSKFDNKINFDELIFELSNEESNAKWNLISGLEQLKKLKLYSSKGEKLNNLVRRKICSIISLKGVEPFIQETFVTGILKELFEARKQGEIPPFLLVLEEAHNFCPESSMGRLKSSKIIRTIAGEGRKFGIGLCVISQRPAKLDKNVISQCTTQIILKITNPNDLKSVVASSEGVDTSSIQEIQKLNIGTCLLTGVIDIPLKVNVRPRLSKHGGETIDITLPYEDKKIIEEEGQEKEEKIKDKEGDFLEFISPEIPKEEIATLTKKENLKSYLIPSTIFKIKISNYECSILVEREKAEIVTLLYPYKSVVLPQDLFNLTAADKKILRQIRKLKSQFNPAELLLNSNMTYNEILRICSSLCEKKLLIKLEKKYEQALPGLEKFKEFHFRGNKKFEEVSVDIYVDENYTTKQIEEVLCMFGEITSKADTFILKYN